MNLILGGLQFAHKAAVGLEGYEGRVRAVRNWLIVLHMQNAAVRLFGKEGSERPFAAVCTNDRLATKRTFGQ
ncbi:MAG: hypothetical protein ABJX32_05295 [Tateyamaria sp.]|uniref:hypothetical protein n=1 Tax=Tateyamaria sp. TaxID=1929288 RepID=UPI0032A06ACC